MKGWGRLHYLWVGHAATLTLGGGHGASPNPWGWLEGHP
jgi:hypothetical protein